MLLTIGQHDAPMELYICFYNYFSTNMTLLTELILILLPRKIPKNRKRETSMKPIFPVMFTIAAG